MEKISSRKNPLVRRLRSLAAEPAFRREREELLERIGIIRDGSLRPEAAPALT